MRLYLPFPTEYASVAASTCQTAAGYGRQRRRLIDANRHARAVLAAPSSASWDRTYWAAALISNRRFAANARAVRHAYALAGC